MMADSKGRKSSERRFFFFFNNALQPLQRPRHYPASMTTRSESSLTFSSDSVSLHPPPLLSAPSLPPSPSLLFSLFNFHFLYIIFFFRSPHSVFLFFFFSTCVGVSPLLLHKQSIQLHKLMSSFRGGQSVRMQSESPASVLPSLTQWFLS